MPVLANLGTPSITLKYYVKKPLVHRAYNIIGAPVLIVIHFYYTIIPCF